MLHCNSVVDLYTFPAAATSPTAHANLAVSSTIWHHRLGLPVATAIDMLQKFSSISCNKVDHTLCHSCQLGKHVRLPFSQSTSHTSTPFEIIHCDVWTSPVASISGFRYYLIILDDFTHFCWTVPLVHKSQAHSHITNFCAYVQTQFGLPVGAVQVDNGTEFVNRTLTTFLASRGIRLRLSCPYTSPQNGKAKRSLRTLDNISRTLLIHTHMPATY
jgi:transposase InsO family protein